jgi:hypothetical protein
MFVMPLQEEVLAVVDMVVEEADLVVEVSKLFFSLK